MIIKDDVPSWILQLDQEDLSFIKRLLLCSGSLKALAKEYDITYPTLRIRLDRLIAKVTIVDSEEDEYIKRIKILASEEKIDKEAAKSLIEDYKRIRYRSYRY